MIGEYTMSEYKAYKNLVKNKKRINRVFSEVYGDRSFRSRRPGRKLKMPAVAVASCSAAPLKSPEMKILQEQPIDCRRDYVFQCSTCENEVSRVVKMQAQILRLIFGC
jgi:hypothetical protein